MLSRQKSEREREGKCKPKISSDKHIKTLDKAAYTHTYANSCSNSLSMFEVFECRRRRRR